MKQEEKLVIGYGLLTTAALIVYFLMMRLAGLAEVTELRSLNALIMFGGVFLAVKKFRDAEFELDFNYFTGIASGFFTGLVTAVSFSVFVGVYIRFDPVFLAAIVADNPQKEFLNPLTAGMTIFIEAMASSFLFSYASMQFLKEDKLVTS
ncbi:MAG: DUF4199 domain-containing protein [Bacteroidota bacterium]